MDDLLIGKFLDYINSKRSTYPPCLGVAIFSFRTDIIDDSVFDIDDKKSSIKQASGKGSATYSNPDNKIIAFVDYENFLDQISPDLIKKAVLKKCDFIVYDLGSDTFFILNELSKSKTAKNKRSDAMSQLSNAANHLMNVLEIKTFINTFPDKRCVFSNRTNPISTPDNMADAFELIKNYLPEPIIHNYQPITKLGFQLIETSAIEV